MPIAIAGAEAFSTVSLASTTRALLRSTESTAATPGRQGRLGDLGGVHLTFADPEREHGAAAQHCSEQREEEGLDGRAHAIDRTQGFIEGSVRRTASFRDCSPPIHATTPTLHLPP